MSTTATGSLSLALQAAAFTLADVTAFRTFCGVSTQADARAKIHYGWLPKPDSWKEGYTLDENRTNWPFAILAVDEATWEKADGSSYEAAGRTRLLIERELPDDPSDADVYLDMLNHIGQIVTGLCDNAIAAESGDGTVAYFQFSDAVLVQPPARASDDEEGSTGIRQWAVVELSFEHAVA